jgi:hypothetical protein
MKSRTQNQSSPQPQGTNRKPVSPAATSNSRVHPPETASSIETKPTSDDIQRRAYEIYLDRQHTGRPGTQTSDWEQAERELRIRSSAR